eukprot:IDg13507t1
MNQKTLSRRHKMRLRDAIYEVRSGTSYRDAAKRFHTP